METVSPDERVLREHLTDFRFETGVRRGRWRIVGCIEWPHVLIAVSAAQRKNSPEEFFFRFDLSGYPAEAPTATPWNPTVAGVLAPELRPKGERIGYVFRSDWENGLALYAPCDRVALRWHPDWQHTYASNAWDATKDLTWVLQFLYRLLNDEDYKGI